MIRIWAKQRSGRRPPRGTMTGTRRIAGSLIACSRCSLPCAVATMMGVPSRRLLSQRPPSRPRRRRSTPARMLPRSATTERRTRSWRRSSTTNSTRLQVARCAWHWRPTLSPEPDGVGADRSGPQHGQRSVRHSGRDRRGRRPGAVPRRVDRAGRWRPDALAAATPAGHRVSRRHSARRRRRESQLRHTVRQPARGAGTASHSFPRRAPSPSSTT